MRLCDAAFGYLHTYDVSGSMRRPITVTPNLRRISARRPIKPDPGHLQSASSGGEDYHMS